MRIPTRRVRGGAAIVLIACVGLIAAPAGAVGKPKRADLTVTAVAPSAAPAAGAKVVLRVTVRNGGKLAAAKSQVVVSLERSPLARANVAKLKARQRKTVSVSLTFPRPTTPGRYVVSACADAAKKVKETSEANNCRTLAQALVVIAPAPAPAVLPSPPGPTAVATPTPTSTPVPTSTPTASPTATATPAVEVPAADLPPLIPSLADTAERLYPAQGVAAGAIAETRAGILRGRTIQRNGSALAGVRVRVHDHPELGSTTTGGDGTFALAVNGGAQITLEYTRAGQLEVQRDIDPTQQDWTSAPDVVMLDASPAGAVLNPPAAGGWTSARALAQSDRDGTRTSTLLFAPGTTATMRFADGSTRALPGPWTVRQTEYTSVGPAAMPGDLPATSGYTYAAELAIDEADAAGADAVVLTAASGLAPAALNYVENFIDAPVGSDVPTGAYDRTAAAWEPAPDGRVVKVVSRTGGMADLDTDGDGDSDAQDYPPALKLTSGERTALAGLYADGTELFRVPIAHMTPWDHNWAWGYPAGAGRPRLGPDGRRLPTGCAQQGSSTIGCEEQKLSEAVRVAGTPYRLAYSSDWEPSAAGRSFDVAITPPALPSGLVAVELEVEVAGQRMTRRYADPTAFAPGTGIAAITPNLVEHVQWDGRNGFGDPVTGTVSAHLTLNYYYELVYYPSDDDFEASFAQLPATGAGDQPFPGRGCSDLAAFSATAPGDLCASKLAVEETRALGAVGRTQVGLGAWDLDVHHIYDAVAGEVRLGDGSVRRGGEIELGRLRTVAGPGAEGAAGSAAIGTGVLGVLADGSILHGGANVIRRVPPGGADAPFAGNGSLTFSGACDGGPALQRSLAGLTAMAVRPDGGVVVALFNGTLNPSSGSRICEIRPDGRLVLLGGAPTAACPSGNDCRGDGGLAKDAPIQQPGALTIAADGAVYFLEEPGPTNGNRKWVRRIDPAGIISSVAGGGDPNLPAIAPEDVPAIGYALRDIRSLLAMADGTLLMADSTAGIIMELGTDGVLRRYAGTFAQTVNYALDVDRRGARIGQPYSIAVGRDGSVFAVVEVTGSELRRRVIRIRPDGVVVRAMGWGAQAPCPATPTELESALDRCGLGSTDLIAVDGDGLPVFADGSVARVRRLEPALPTPGLGGKAIPSVDGREVWLFDASGRHLSTVDGLTGAKLLEFGYDAAGRLVRVEDADGRKTLIERDGAGAAIVAPDGRRTTLGLNAAGKLSAITDPTGAIRGLSYDGGGRLSGQQLPSGRHSSYSYDAAGRLTDATGAAGQTRHLARTELAAGGIAVDVTTGAGRSTRYSVEPTAGGGVRRTVRTPSGSVTTLAIDPDGVRTLTLPSGETRRTTTTSDKRFGAAVARVRSRTTRAPSGKSVTVTSTYAATLAAPGQPLHPSQLTTDVAGPGGTTHSVYTGASRTLKTTTPGGREETTTFDVRGRPLTVQAGTLAPVTFEYGAQGGVSRVAQGAQSTRYERDAAGRLTAIVAADGQRLEYGYDAADRVTERRYPGGRTYRYGRDADGVLTSRRLPSARTHGFSPTGLEEQISAWTPPGGGGYAVVRDDDEQATSVTSPSGAVRTVSYDAAGRVTGAAFAGAARTATYVPGVDRIDRYESTVAPASAVQALDPEFDGMRVTKLTAEGLSPAQTTWTYDAALRHASTQLVSGADNVTLAYTRDADGVLTGAGPFTYERGGPNKTLSAITDGTGRTVETIDAVADLQTRRLTVGGSERYLLELTTDATGRVSARREVAGASDHTYAYGYDANGELTEVRRDGVVVESYAYDLDGDRTSQNATYDARGALTGRGGTSYTFDADGFLAARGADTFTYARSGELRSATAGGTTVGYAYDALGRLVARVQGADTTRLIYGDPDSPYRVSAARAPDGTLDRYLYGPRGNLYAILRGAARFHVATDQVGSPRVVVAADGTVVKRLEYDAYGITTDLDPGFFLPFGYAGGLRDPVTGLVRFGLRDYEPQSGRFTARDPAMFAGSPRSLYGYANNSPLSYRDPGGTASISISGYGGGGGGATFYFDPKALFDWNEPLITGLCVEAGLGVGGGIEADFLEQAPEEASLSAFGELSGKYGPGGVKFGGEFDLICGRGKLKGGGNLGPLQASYDGENLSTGSAVDPSGETPDDQIGNGTGFKAEGKAGFKACLPPPPR